MARGGRHKVRANGPERRCVATGTVMPAARLVRCVVAPDGVLAADLAGKLPGRGVWITPDRGAIARAVKRSMFERSLRRPVTLPPDLCQQIDGGMARRLINFLRLARKSGQATAGSDRVHAWLESNNACVLLLASDRSGRRDPRLAAETCVELVTCLTTAEMGEAFERSRVVHAALTSGGLARCVVVEALRLQTMRNGTAQKQVISHSKDDWTA